MVAFSVDFASLLLAALAVGAMFAVCLIFNPAGLDAATYVWQHQWGVRALNVKLPILGVATTAVTLAAALLERSDRTRLALLLIAAGLFIIAGLITRFLNQPINATVMTWSAQSPPEGWMRQRNAWWRWHITRFSAGLAGLCMLIVAALRSGGCTPPCSADF